MQREMRCFIVLILLAAAASSVSAQLANRMMRVNVPFPFLAAGRGYPAGNYTVKIDRETGLVTLGSWPNSALVPTSNELRPAEPDSAYLRFGHFDKWWVLEEIVSNGRAQEFSPGKLENELAKSKLGDRKIFASKIDR
jgi:hypothetical protein